MAARASPPVREVQAVNLLQVGGRIVSAAAGGPREALAALAATGRATYVCAIDRPAEAMVLSGDGGLGASFNQADKAVKNSEIPWLSTPMPVTCF